MAIQPIDLQTLFSQVDKVGKDQANQKNGLQVQQSIHGMQQQQKDEQKIQSVNEAQDTGQGAEKIKDRGPKGGAGQDEKNKREKDSPEAEPEKDAVNVVKDPDLGQNIDVSG